MPTSWAVSGPVKSIRWLPRVWMKRSRSVASAGSFCRPVPNPARPLWIAARPRSTPPTQ